MGNLQGFPVARYQWASKPFGVDWGGNPSSYKWQRFIQLDNNFHQICANEKWMEKMEMALKNWLFRVV